MDFDATFKGVEIKVGKVFEPKGNQRGYTYGVKVINPPKELKQYLNTYGSINISSLDTEPRWGEKQIGITLTLGVKVNKKGNKTYINGYIVDELPEKQLGEDFNKELEEVSPLEAESVAVDGNKERILLEEKMEAVEWVVEAIKPLSAEGQQAIVRWIFEYIK